MGYSFFLNKSVMNLEQAINIHPHAGEWQLILIRWCAKILTEASLFSLEG